MKYTQNNEEIKHLNSIQKQIKDAVEEGFLIRVTLLDERIFEGILSEQSSGKNGVSSSNFYENLSLITLDKQKLQIDLLNIKKVVNATTQEKINEYDKAGVITLVDSLAKDV